MRTRNNPLISVIIPESEEGVLTAIWAKRELTYIPHEIIVAPSWILGANDSIGEYVCFLEKDCVLDTNYFEQLLEIFEEQTAFRKLAMVAPAIAVGSYNASVFGYRFVNGTMKPCLQQSSSEPYLVQIAYAPGALIRRSALGFLAPSQDALGDSATLCIYFWDHGQRIVLDPRTLYISTDTRLDRPYEFKNPVSKIKVSHIMNIFNREEIG